MFSCLEFGYGLDSQGSIPGEGRILFFSTTLIPPLELVEPLLK
jgi:hypothetical protein